MVRCGRRRVETLGRPAPRAGSSRADHGGSSSSHWRSGCVRRSPHIVIRAPVPDRLPTPDDAWSRVAERWCPPELPIESVPLLAALGRVTAVAIRSALDSPPFDRAAMDGYAVRAADLQRCERLRIAGSVPMGSLAVTTLAEGDAISVATGSMIPRGADAVINLERTDRTDADIEISGAVGPGDNIVRRGEDVRCGAVVLSAGRRLRPQDIGLLASLGHLHVPCRAVACASKQSWRPISRRGWAVTITRGSWFAPPRGAAGSPRWSKGRPGISAAWGTPSGWAPRP